MTLMIVDDNLKMRQMIRTLFIDMFDSLIECSSGEEAIDSYEKTFPDWVLMDIKMKKLNGIAATKQIIQKHPEAKIIIITQYEDTALHDAAINAGAVSYYHKEDITAIPGFIKSQLSKSDIN